MFLGFKWVVNVIIVCGEFTPAGDLLSWRKKVGKEQCPNTSFPLRENAQNFRRRKRSELIRVLLMIPQNSSMNFAHLLWTKILATPTGENQNRLQDRVIETQY